MFDFGWAEILLIVAVAAIVIGPEQLPDIMRALGRFVRRLQYIRYAFSQQFDDFLKTHDLEELRKGVNLEARGQSDEESENHADRPSQS